MSRKYDALIEFTYDLDSNAKDRLNEYYEKAFEMLGINHDNKPLLLKMLAIYIVRETWHKYDLEIIDRVIDDWFHYYETGFIEYQNSFALVTEDFDLHLSYAIKFLTEKAP